MRLLYGHDEAVIQWVLSKISHVSDFGPCVAIGIVDDGPIGGAVFHDYKPDYKTVQLSMAADTPRWAQRSIIKEILSYPFEQAGVEKVWTATPHTNERAIKFNKGIGFTQEAVLAKHFGDQHAVICRMFKKDFNKLFERQ